LAERLGGRRLRLSGAPGAAAESEKEGAELNRATSLYLDLVRPMAAVIVLLSHVSQHDLTGGQLGVFAYTGVEAVDVFFVLSGFVIAHVYATREADWRAFAISRAARIYSVAIPALVLTALADAIGQSFDMTPYQSGYQAFTPGLLVRSLLFLGEQWNAHRFPGTDGPYWSLGFEVWYYVAFGVFVFAPGRWRWLATIGVLAFIGPKVSVMFSAWLMGAASYRLCASDRVRPALGWFLLVAPIVILAAYECAPHSGLQQFTQLSFSADRIDRLARDTLIAILFSSHIVGFAAVSPRLAPWLERHAGAIRWIAGATFSLYLAHLPIMHLLAALSPWPKSSVLTLVLLLVATPILCLLFAEVSERRKEAWRSAATVALRAVESSAVAMRRLGERSRAAARSPR
jgi:peptidoglycan/LPS O-acetylase OafA/YrhL